MNAALKGRSKRSRITSRFRSVGGILVLGLLCTVAAADEANSTSIGQPSVFWHDGKWQIVTNDHWVPYADSKKIVAQNERPSPAPLPSPEYPIATNDVDYIYAGGVYGPGAFPVSRHPHKKRGPHEKQTPDSGLGRPNVGIGQPTIGIGQPNGGIGQPNIGIGQNNTAIGQPNNAIGQTTIGIGQPNDAIGRRNVELGQPNNAIGQTTIGIGQQAAPLAPTTVAIGQPTIGIGKPTIGIGKPLNSPRPQPSKSHAERDR